MDSPLCYIGGKSRLADTIVPLFPKHTTYCEVFAGAAWVFFRKPISKFEVINDLDGDLISFYRVVQNHLEEFLRQFKFLLHSRQIFEEWGRQLTVGGLTDIQRAARYFYVQRLCFGGRVRGRTFGAGVDHAPRINFFRLEEELTSVHLRLARVTIENIDYKDFLRRYDKSSTFFYLDPPYYKMPYYAHNLDKLDDFVEMAKVLKKVRGKFVMSINDHEDIKRTFGDFQIRTVSLRYSAGQTTRSEKFKELLVMNY